MWAVSIRRHMHMHPLWAPEAWGLMFKVRGGGGGSVDMVSALSCGRSLKLALWTKFIQRLAHAFHWPINISRSSSAPPSSRTLLASPSQCQRSILREADALQCCLTQAHRRIEVTTTVHPSPRASTPTLVSKLDRHRVWWRREIVELQRNDPFNVHQGRRHRYRYRSQAFLASSRKIGGGRV